MTTTTPSGLARGLRTTRSYSTVRTMVGSARCAHTLCLSSSPRLGTRHASATTTTITSSSPKGRLPWAGMRFASSSTPSTATATGTNAAPLPKIPDLQWAQVLEKKGGPVVYKQIPVPKPGPDEVLINVKYSGVCHTDLHAVMGDWPVPVKMPLIGGHEGAGVVVGRGELVTDIELGDYAGIKWLHGSCMTCEHCRQSDESLCAAASLSGYTVDGSFQQYAVAKAAHVARLPRDLDNDLAGVAPILCAGLTVYKALKTSGARPGQQVAIAGAAGGLGVFALQYARAMGLHAIAIDGGSPEKGKVCMRLGAQAFVDFMKPGQDVVEEVRRATHGGKGPDVALLLAASEKPFEQASKYVKSKGTIVCVGLPADAYIKAPVFDTVVREIRVKGSYVGNRQDTAEAIDFFRRGLIKAPYKIVGLSQLQEVYEMMKRGETTGRYVVDTSK